MNKHTDTTKMGKKEVLPYSGSWGSKLCQSAERYRFTINNVNEVLFELDEKGLWIFLNPVWTELTGFPVSESLGNLYLNYVHPSDRADYQDLFKALLERKIEALRHQVRYLTKTGDFRWLEVYARVKLAEDGTIAGALGTLKDISDHSLAEPELKNDEICFKQVFTHSAAVWLLIEPDTGIILEANAAATNFYGYSIEELKTMAIFDLDVSGKDQVKKFMDSVGSNVKGQSIFQHKLKNGKTRDIKVFASPFSMLLSFIIIDITDSRRAAEALQRSRDRLAVVIEATKAGIWEHDIVSRKLIFRDHRFMAMMGYKENESGSSDDSWESFCHIEDIPYIKKAAEEYMTGKVDRFNVECRMKHKDGTYRWIRSTGKIVFDRDKQPVRWVGSNIDITDRKKIEELQKQYKDILKDFAQVISDVSFIIDEDGIFVAVFGDDEELFLIPKRSIPGLTLFDVLQNELAIRLLTEIRLTLKEQKPRSFKHMMNLPKGKRSMMTRMSLMNYCVNGKRTVAIASMDITEQEKAKDLLQASYEMRRRSDVLNDLLAGMRSLDEETRAYINKTGLSFAAPLFCCVINSRHVVNDKRESTFDMQGVQDEMMDLLNGLQGCIAWGCRGKIGVLCKAADATLDSKDYSICIARNLQAKIKESYPELEIMIGIGEVRKGLEGFRKSFQQAWEAIVASRCNLGSSNEVIHFRDMGIFQLLVEKSGCERANEFIGHVIGKLIRQDAEKGTDYLETLEVILQSSNLKEAAKILFLHYNTLVFRKRRIEEVLGVSINEFDTRLTLATAIKLYKLSLLR